MRRGVLRIVRLFEQRMRCHPMYDVLFLQLDKSLSRFVHLSGPWSAALVCRIMQCGGFLEQLDGSDTSYQLVQQTVSLLNGLPADTDDTTLSVKLAQQFEGFYFQATGICLSSGKTVVWNSLAESFHAFARRTTIVDVYIGSNAHTSEAAAAAWFQTTFNGDR